MTKGNLTKLPITDRQRIRNMQGEFSVPCEVSERWLSFGRTSDKLSSGEFIYMDVMTMGNNDKPRKICNLIITRENLLKVLSKIKAKEV
jgi:hypothetical protein